MAKRRLTRNRPPLTKEEAKRKIAKLDRLAEPSSGATDGERHSARMQAAKLRQRYGLTGNALALYSAPPKKPSKKKGKKKATKKKATKKKATKKKATKKKATKKKATKKRSKKVSKRRSSKKNCYRTKTVRRRVKVKCPPTRRKKRSSKKGAPCGPGKVCIPKSKYDALRKALARLAPTKGDSADIRDKKAKARARVRAQWAKLKAAAACRLGVQRAKKAGQKIRAKCPKPPPRSVHRSAQVLGNARAKKAGEKTQSVAALTRAFLKS
jgi:hypothetical protein